MLVHDASSFEYPIEIGKQLATCSFCLLHVSTDHDEGQTRPLRPFVGYIFTLHGDVELRIRICLVLGRELVQQTLANAKPYAAVTLRNQTTGMRGEWDAYLFAPVTAMYSRDM